MFADSFYTIKQPVTGSFKDKGSKFISYAFPVNTESEIKNHLLQLKKEHVGARHFCYAWRLGANKEAWRTQDDGEPSSSAGKPIYSQIQSNDLTNILIVVVRYFGGTLLGVSGLINAYKSSAEDSIKNAVIIEKFIYFQYKLIFDVSDVNAVMKLLKEIDAQIISQDYNEHYTVIVNVKKKLAENLEEKIKNIYNAKLTYLITL